MDEGKWRGYRGFDPKYHSRPGLSEHPSEVRHVLGLKEQRERKLVAVKRAKVQLAFRI